MEDSGSHRYSETGRLVRAVARAHRTRNRSEIAAARSAAEALDHYDSLVQLARAVEGDPPPRPPPPGPSGLDAAALYARGRYDDAFAVLSAEDDLDVAMNIAAARQNSSYLSSYVMRARTEQPPSPKLAFKLEALAGMADLWSSRLGHARTHFLEAISLAGALDADAVRTAIGDFACVSDLALYACILGMYEMDAEELNSAIYAHPSVRASLNAHDAKLPLELLRRFVSHDIRGFMVALERVCDHLADDTFCGGKFQNTVKRKLRKTITLAFLKPLVRVRLSACGVALFGFTDEESKEAANILKVEKHIALALKDAPKHMKSFKIDARAGIVERRAGDDERDVDVLESAAKATWNFVAEAESLLLRKSIVEGGFVHGVKQPHHARYEPSRDFEDEDDDMSDTQ